MGVVQHLNLTSIGSAPMDGRDGTMDESFLTKHTQIPQCLQFLLANREICRRRLVPGRKRIVLTSMGSDPMDGCERYAEPFEALT